MRKIGTQLRIYCPAVLIYIVDRAIILKASGNYAAMERVSGHGHSKNHGKSVTTNPSQTIGALRKIRTEYVRSIKS
jgi:hypothetical protein